MLDSLGPLLGPITFIQDVSWQNQLTGVVACAILVPCMAVGLFRPRWLSLLAAIIAVGIWLLLGAVGLGISC